VLELGTNHFGELAHLAQIAQPTHALITNIGREHLEFFKDLKGVAKAEGELFEYAQKNDIKVFINEDDVLLKPWIKKFSKDKTTTFSVQKKASVTGKIGKYNSQFQAEVKWQIPKNNFVSQVPLFGRSGAQAALAAVSVASALGLSTTEINKGFETFTLPSKGRMECLSKKWGTLINDTYNSNPESVFSALETLVQMKIKGKIILALGDMLELGKNAKALHEEIGGKIKKLKFNYLFCHGPLSLQTSKKAGALKLNRHFVQKKDLIKELTGCIEPGDVVYVKGSRGMMMEEVVQAISKG
jgi:UDP-N-acetylmuramoyl-tripeptide--D-alanyl-D-alanine ligase